MQATHSTSYLMRIPPKPHTTRQKTLTGMQRQKDLPKHPPLTGS